MMIDGTVITSATWKAVSNSAPDSQPPLRMAIE
jgi:hypothetical protein